MNYRPYQQEDIQFLSQHSRSACFNEQRTGKTIIALGILLQQQAKKTLIIAPASALYSWQEEYTKWTRNNCIVVAGTRKQKLNCIESWTHGLAISYDSFKKIIRNGKEYSLYREVLAHTPSHVVLDEAHRIKGRTTAAARAAFLCRNVPNRIALTGTPVSNKCDEIFAILHWLYPKTFTSYYRFRDYFFHLHHGTNMTTGSSYTEVGGLKASKQLELLATLNKISTQRKRKEVMPWLPEIDRQTIKLPCTPHQEKYLNELHTMYETEHIITQGDLDRLMRERQICLHPKLLELPGTSPKLEWLQDYVNDYRHTPMIIFSKFTSWLKLIYKELKGDTALIIGKTPLNTRQEYIRKFQKGQLNILLINLDAGKEALTLDHAEVTIFTDKFPPVGDIQQAEARFLSTTIDKKDKPHLIIDLCMKGTYEETILSMIKRNAKHTDVINDYKKYLEGR